MQLHFLPGSYSLCTMKKELTGRKVMLTVSNMFHRSIIDSLGGFIQAEFEKMNFCNKMNMPFVVYCEVSEVWCFLC